MAEPSFLVLIVGFSGRLRESMRAMLATMPWVSEIQYADSCEAGAALAASSSSCLALINADLLHKEQWHRLREFKRLCRQVHFCVIAQTTQQRKAALSAGADNVLLQGFSTHALRTAVYQGLAASTTAVATPDLRLH